MYLFPQVLGLVGVSYGVANQTRQKWMQQGQKNQCIRAAWVIPPSRDVTDRSKWYCHP